MTPGGYRGGIIPSGRAIRSRDEDHALIVSVSHDLPRDVVEVRTLKQDGQARYAGLPAIVRDIEGSGATGVHWVDQHEAEVVPPLLAVPRDVWDVIVAAIDDTRPTPPADEPRLQQAADRLRDVEAQRDALIATVGRLADIIDRIGGWLGSPVTELVPDYTPDVRPGRQDHDTATEGPTR